MKLVMVAGLPYLLRPSCFVEMWSFYRARLLRKKHIEFVEIKDYIGALKDLMHDEPSERSQYLVFYAWPTIKAIDSNIIYSIFRKTAQRADIIGLCTWIFQRSFWRHLFGRYGYTGQGFLHTPFIGLSRAIR